MDEFWKAVAAVLISVILGLAIGKTEKDFSVLLTMTVCSIVAVIAFQYLTPVLELLWELNELAQFQNDALELLLKAVGIELISELSALVCADTGNNSAAKTLQLLGSTAIAFLTVPIIQSVLSLIRDILFTI